MKTVKTFFFLLCFISTLFLNAQTFELLKSGTKIEGHQTYILPKSSFIIEIPVITTEISKGKINYDILTPAQRIKIAKIFDLDTIIWKSLKGKKPIKKYKITEDSIKITMTAIPDYEKVIYVTSSSKWYKNQSINFTYSSDGMLSTGESNSENKSLDIVVKGLSGVVSIAGAAFRGDLANVEEDPIYKNIGIETEAKELQNIIRKYDDLSRINNFDIYKDVKNSLEKKYAKIIAELFYGEKKKATIYKLYYTPKKEPVENDLIPFFELDTVCGKIFYSKDLEDQIWAKNIDSTATIAKDKGYSFSFNYRFEQQIPKFENRPGEATGFAFNIPKKVAFNLKNKSAKLIFSDVFKVPQFGILGYVDSKKNAKLTYSLDSITGELIKLSVTGSAILTDQVGAATSMITEGVNLIKGDSDDIKLEKEVKRLELEKKKNELLQQLE